MSEVEITILGLIKYIDYKCVRLLNIKIWSLTVAD